MVCAAALTLVFALVDTASAHDGEQDEGRHLLEGGLPILPHTAPLALPQGREAERDAQAWWSARERALEGDGTIASPRVAQPVRSDWIETLDREGWAAWERAWLAHAAAEGALPLAHAVAYDAALRPPDDGPLSWLADVTLQQRLLWADAFAAGSGLATLPPRCLSVSAGEDGDVARWLASFSERAPWRFAFGQDLALTEQNALLQAWATEAGSDAAGVVAMSIADVAASAGTAQYWASAASTIAELTDGPEAATACFDPHVVALLSLASADRAEWSAASDGVLLVYRTRLVPTDVTIRLAVHRYLADDTASLRLLHEASRDTLGAVGGLGDRIAALRAGTERDADSMLRLARSAGTPRSAFDHWVLGEAYRMSGDYGAARRAHSAAIDRDARFVAALLGRASSALHSNRLSVAIRDLEHLRTFASEHPAYATFVHALERRIAAE